MLDTLIHQLDAMSSVVSGEARYVTAADALADPKLVVGCGVFMPIHRTYPWCHIARVEKGDGDTIKIVFVTTFDTPDYGRDYKCEGIVTHELTITKVIEQTIAFQPTDVFAVTKDQLARPRGRRIGKIITWVNELTD